ncbi:MAG: hypothetical protein P8129_03325 [Anaerolineae bacterium]|jgi:hypothetical protein
MMIDEKQVLLLVGSAKHPRSNSQALGSYLCGRLEEEGYRTETVLLSRALRSEAGLIALLDATDHAGLVVLAFPLYVDSLPYLVVKALESIVDHRRGRDREAAQRLVSRQRFVAVANCGFPEAHHNDVALAICRRFAAEAGFRWAGGLALGGGEALGGQSPAARGGMTRHVVEALDLAAAALARGEDVPAEAVEMMARPLIPARLYTWMGGLGWWLQARKHGVARRLRARPYLQE